MNPNLFQAWKEYEQESIIYRYQGQIAAPTAQQRRILKHFEDAILHKWTYSSARELIIIDLLDVVEQQQQQQQQQQPPNNMNQFIGPPPPSSLDTVTADLNYMAHSVYSLALYTSHSHPFLAKFMATLLCTQEEEYHGSANLNLIIRPGPSRTRVVEMLQQFEGLFADKRVYPFCKFYFNVW